MFSHGPVRSNGPFAYLSAVHFWQCCLSNLINRQQKKRKSASVISKDLGKKIRLKNDEFKVKKLTRGDYYFGGGNSKLYERKNDIKLFMNCSTEVSADGACNGARESNPRISASLRNESTGNHVPLACFAKCVRQFSIFAFLNVGKALSAGTKPQTPLKQFPPSMGLIGRLKRCSPNSLDFNHVANSSLRIILPLIFCYRLKFSYDNSVVAPSLIWKFGPF